MEVIEREFLKEILEINDIKIYVNENLKNWTTFHCAGNHTKFLLVCQTKKSLIKVFNIIKTYELKHKVIGAGSNILFVEKMFNGVIIKLGSEFTNFKICKNSVSVGAGMNLFKLAKNLADNSLGGLEWAYCIPASVGGATLNNAGAFGHEIQEFIKKVEIFDGKKFYWIEDIKFTYRDSSLRNSEYIVTAVKLSFENKNKSEIEKLQKSYLQKRKNLQPFGEFCAGSVFKQFQKNGEIFYPAKIIDNLGLKGVKIGQAKVSEKHAGFIVNEKDATSREVIELINLVKDKVKTETGFELETEIEFV